MRPRSLYLKILLSFVGILLLTEALILVLFIFGAGRHFKEKVESYTGAKVLMARDYIQDTIRADKGSAPVGRGGLAGLLHKLGSMYGAKLWVEDGQGRLLAGSFEGDIPDTGGFCQTWSNIGPHSVQMRKSRRSPRGYYTQSPLILSDGSQGSLHIIFLPPSTSPAHEEVFFIGLLVIGAVVALLTIPVSRLITRPVNRLRRSAIRIADGELSHRAEIGTRDEIGQLGAAFNHMAARLEEMIRGGKELTANVSHELRSPLARIRVAQELIRRKAEQEGYDGLARHLDAIREDIEEQDKIIERIMMLSKMDLREEPLEMAWVDPADIVGEILERSGPLLERKSLRLQTDLSWRGRAALDPEAFGTAVANLVDNALKFTPRGGRIRVAINREGGRLVLGLANTFREMSPKELQELFTPFHKADPAQGGGTGLGLAIVKRIVEKHGGSVAAESREGEFVIRMELPAGG